MIGLLQLDTRFPRPIGDVGNPLSWRRPLSTRVLNGVTVRDVVRSSGPDPRAVDIVIENARALAMSGCDVVTTSCGFFAAIQSAVQPCIDVPFVSSSLTLITKLLSDSYSYTSAHLGVLTFDVQALSAAHFVGVGAPFVQAIEGLPAESYLRKCIEHNETTLSLAHAEANVVQCAQRLKSRFPDVRVIVLECTNLGVYRHAVEHATGCKVLDIVDAVAAIRP
jgi:aspartate/glutamate racemase